MQSQSLKDFVTQNGQVTTAEKVGMTQGAISQILIRNREAYVTLDPHGEPVDFYEIKRLGKFRK